MTWKTYKTVTFSYDETIKSTCMYCKCETNHKILVSANVTSSSKKENVEFECVDSFTEWMKYQVIQCLGCGLIMFREESTDENHYPNPPIVNFYFNPAQRYQIEDVDLIPKDDIKKIYKGILI